MDGNPEVKTCVNVRDFRSSVKGDCETRVGESEVFGNDKSSFLGVLVCTVYLIFRFVSLWMRTKGVIFTLDAKCPVLNLALCREKFASQWLEGRIFTVCFRTGIALFNIIVLSVL